MRIIDILLLTRELIKHKDYYFGNKSYPYETKDFISGVPALTKASINNLLKKETKMKERRVLKLEVLERNAGAVRFKIAEQSHRQGHFGNTNIVTGESGWSYFEHNGFSIASINHPFVGLTEMGVKGMAQGCDDDILICYEEIYDKKIVPAVKAYNDTNGGFGFDDVCPTCGQEIKDWKPVRGENYFYIDSDSRIENAYNAGCDTDKESIEFGNAFKTKELAEIAAGEVKKVLKAAKHA